MLIHSSPLADGVVTGTVIRSNLRHTIKTFRRFITRWTWRRASPPAPNHAQSFGRLTASQGSAPATPDTPMTKGEFHASLWIPSTISLKPTLRGLDAANISLLDIDQEIILGYKYQEKYLYYVEKPFST